MLRALTSCALVGSAALGLASIGPTGVLAQALPPGPTVGGGVTYQNFRFSDEDAAVLSSVSMLSVPFAARVSPYGALAIELSGAFARGELERPDGQTTTISGLADTRIRVGLSDLLDERLSISAVALLATGEDTFTGEQAALAGIVAADLLPFQVSSWGSGGGVGADVAFVQPVDFGNVRLGGTFIVPGEFDAVEGPAARYQAGPVVQVSAGIDRNVGPASRLSLQGSFQRYGDDEVEGQTLFRAGNRVQLLGSYAFPAGDAGSGIAYAGFLHRSQGAALAATAQDRPGQSLIYGGIGLRQNWRGSVLVPKVEGRVIRRESGEDQGVLGGAGLSLERPVGAVRVIPAATVRFGTLEVRDGVSSSIVGLELGFTIRGSRRGATP